MSLINSPDGADVYCSRAGAVEGIGSVWGLKVV